MVFVAFGLAALLLLLWVARAFSRASVATVKGLLAWVAALAGLSLVCLLLLTGKGAAALSGLVLAGPLVWEQWRRHASGGRPRSRPPARSGPMTRAEALDVLGLADPVTDGEVREAWLRLMRVAHPDGGGSDWLAARINQAKDVLLQKR